MSPTSLTSREPAIDVGEQGDEPGGGASEVGEPAGLKEEGATEAGRPASEEGELTIEVGEQERGAAKDVGENGAGAEASAESRDDGGTSSTTEVGEKGKRPDETAAAPTAEGTEEGGKVASPTKDVADKDECCETRRREGDTGTQDGGNPLEPTTEMGERCEGAEGEDIATRGGASERGEGGKVEGQESGSSQNTCEPERDSAASPHSSGTSSPEGRVQTPGAVQEGPAGGQREEETPQRAPERPRAQAALPFCRTSASRRRQRNTDAAR